MTSLLTTAALAPMILALVPCLFLAGKDALTPDGDPSRPGEEVPLHAPDHASADRSPWWKPSALGIDNYS